MLIDEVLLHETTLSRLVEVAVLSNAEKPTQRVKESREISYKLKNKMDIQKVLIKHT